MVGNQEISCANSGGSGNSGNSRYVHVHGLTADFVLHATASNQTGSEGRSRNGVGWSRCIDNSHIEWLNN